MLQEVQLSDQAAFSSIAGTYSSQELLPMLQGFVLGYMGVPLSHPLFPPILTSFREYQDWIKEGLLSNENIISSFLAALKNVSSHHNREEKDYDQSLYEMRKQVEHYLNQVVQNPLYFEQQQQAQRSVYDPKNEVLMSLELCQAECEICSTSMNPEQVAILDCTHVFHIHCMHQLIKVKIEEGEVDSIRCPQEHCSIEMSQNQIMMFLTPELEEKYMKFQQNRYVEVHGDCTSWCPTPNCPVIFEYDPAVVKYKCKSCCMTYCLKCRCEFHHGMTCQEHKDYTGLNPEDKCFVDAVRGAKFKQCPKCKFWVQRTKGCSHMTCRCGESFCYKCGRAMSNGRCSCS